MQVPLNPFRQALANMYMENYLGKPEIETIIKKEVNGDNDNPSLDYYIGMERAISRAITVFKDMNFKDMGTEKSVNWMYSAMIQYISYEIERLSTFKGND